MKPLFSPLETARPADAGKEPEESFEHFYRRNITPHAEAFEARRQEARDTIAQRKKIGLIASGGLALMGLFLLAKGSPLFALLLAGGGGAGLYFWVTAPKRAYQADVKSTVLPAILKFFGEDFRLESGARNPIKVRELAKSGILPSYDSADLEDYVGGTYRGQSVEATELRLTRERKEKDRKIHETVFEGLALRLGVSKPFQGKTVIRADRGGTVNFFGHLLSGLSRIRLEDPRFERLFEVSGSDQIEARTLLTPGFMERFVELAGRHPGIQACFADQRMLILIPTRDDFFEVTSSFEETVDFRREADSIRSEMALILGVSESLGLASRTGL